MATASVGRWVHYIMPDGQHRPACIVKVNKAPMMAAISESMPRETVHLQVLTAGPEDSFGLSDKYSPDFRMAINSGMFLATNVLFDPIDMNIGSWHWQEYVE